MTFLPRLTHKHILIILGIFLTVFLCTVTPILVSAQEGTAVTAEQQSAAQAGASAETGIDEQIRHKTELNYVNEIIYGVTTAFGGLVVRLGGLLLDGTIKNLVIEMGDIYESNVGYSVNMLWKVIRDALNMLFIFGLVFIGIKTILNSEDSGTRRALGLLIAAALLINFSLYITKVVVDFSNIAAIQIHTSMVNGITGSSGINLGSARFTGGEDSIAGAFLQVSRATTLFSDVSHLNVLAYSIMTLIFLIVAGMVFAFGAFMLLARFIALTIYMIFSPIMFLGWIFPQLMSFSKNWWKGFFKQAFFAPAFFFMLYLTLSVLQGLGSANSFQGNIAGDLGNPDATGQAGFGGVMFFALAIGFLYASTVVGQKMGVAGGNAAVGTLQGMKNKITGNMKSFAGRNTLGRYGSWRASTIEKNEATRGGRIRNRITTAATLGAFDTQSRLKSAKGLKDNKFGGSRSISSQEEWKKEREKLQATGEKANEAEAVIKEGITQMQLGSAGNKDSIIAMEEMVAQLRVDQLEKMDKDILKEIAGSLGDKKYEEFMKSDKVGPETKKVVAAARSTAIKNRLSSKKDAGGNLFTYGQGIGTASANELKALDFKDLVSNAAYLSDSQMKDLEKAFDSDTKYEMLNEARKTNIKNIVENNPREIPTVLRGKKDQDIAKLGPILTHRNMTPWLKPGILEKIGADKTLDPEKRAIIKNNIMSADGVSPAVLTFMMSDKGQEYYGRWQ